MNLDIIVLPLRIVQAVFALIVLALCAYVASWFNSHIINISPSEVNFLIFAGVFTLVIAIPYIVLAPRFFPAGAHKFALLGVEAVTMIFWFAGFIALAAGLGAISGVRYGGSPFDSMKAATVFGAFEWLAFAATTTLTALGAVRSKGSTAAPHAGV